MRDDDVYVTLVFEFPPFVNCNVDILFAGLADCFFPDYLQGEFSMQSLNSLPGQIKYTPVSITPDSVNIYGYCHKKMGNGNYLIAKYVCLDIVSGIFLEIFLTRFYVMSCSGIRRRSEGV